MQRRAFLATVALTQLSAQEQPRPDFVCPMDPDVRSPGPAKCPRCGMKLVAGIPDPTEFLVDFRTIPRVPKPGGPVNLLFRVRDPRSGRAAKLELIHEKLFHLFIVHQSMGFFAHEHPEMLAEGWLTYKATLPLNGMYRLLCDFYPEKAIPQMIPKTLLLGRPSHGGIIPVMTPSAGDSPRFSVRTEPEQPIAGKKTMLFLKLTPREGLERYLGAWGHLLAVSTDLVDMMHSHPAWDDPGPEVQFNVILPRPGAHRLWAQFQVLGRVKTFDFEVNARAL